MKITGPATLLRAACSVCYLADARMTRFLRNFPRGASYELRGACNGCGACCETPAIMVPRVIYHSSLFRRLFLAWHRTVNGFEYIGEEHEGHTLVFRCRHFDPETRRCDCYATRPGPCRDYPRALLEDPNPEFFATCGYRPVYKHAEAMREALTGEGLPPEKIAELEEKLRLK